MSNKYSETIKWYYSFARFDTKRSDKAKLDRMREILARLKNPQKKFRSIHVAGTKGKGSTAAMIECMIRAGGHATGLFTSPHLHTFRERIRVANRMISEEEVVAYTRKLRKLSADFPDATFFEWVTALAFLHFAAQEIELAVVEAGLGGRLDCTNVIEPRVTVITPLSLDHTDILGNNILQIAREKAGIIKPGVPVVIAPQPLRVLGEIQRKANQAQVRIINVEKNWRWQLLRTTPEAQIVNVRFSKNARWQPFLLPLVGPHQRVNLATALAAVDVLHGRNWRISVQSMQEGLANLEWPARFEVLARLDANTDEDEIPDDTDLTLDEMQSTLTTPSDNAPVHIEPHGYLIADGAHNAASAAELVRTLDEIFPARRVHFIFAASSDKDIAGMFAALAPRAESFTLTQAQSPRAAAIETLVEFVAPHRVTTYTAPNIGEAIEDVLDRIEPTDVVCVTGSLFIAAEARAYFLDTPKDE